MFCVTLTKTIVPSDSRVFISNTQLGIQIIVYRIIESYRLFYCLSVKKRMVKIDSVVTEQRSVKVSTPISSRSASWMVSSGKCTAAVPAVQCTVLLSDSQF